MSQSGYVKLPEDMNIEYIQKILEQLRSKDYMHLKNSKADIRIVKISFKGQLYLVCGERYIQYDCTNADDCGVWKDFVRVFDSIDTLAWFISSL